MIWVFSFLSFNCLELDILGFINCIDFYSLSSVFEILNSKNGLKLSAKRLSVEIPPIV